MSEFNPVQTTVVNTPAPDPAPAAPAAPAPTEAPAPADGPSGATKSTPPSGEQGNGSPPQQPEWARRRIDELTRARREAERQRDAHRAELEALRARAAPATPAAPAASAPASVPSVDDVEQQVRQRLAAEAYDRRCNETYQRAVSADPDFAGAYAQMLQDVGAPPAPILEAIIEGDDAVAVLGHLARNYDDASRLFALSPVAMGRELERLSAKVRSTPKPPVVSQAPAPAEASATGSGTSAAGSDDWGDMPLDEFMKKRNTSTRRKR